MSVRRVLLLVALVAAMLGFTIGPAWACSCASAPPRQVAADADAVFTGTVASVPRVSGQTVTVDFEVDTVYKGPSGPRLTVHTSAFGASCGVVFRPNQRYTVFAFRDHGLAANLCSPPVVGDIEPSRYGLTVRLVDIHEHLSQWLAALSVIPLAIVALLVVRQRRARIRNAASGPDA